MENPTLGLAFLAGFLSFVSPCVLPLVPAYIGYLGGRMTHRVAAQVAVGAGENAAASTPSLGNRFNTLVHGAAFVIGFAFVFVSLGLLSTAFLSVIGGSNISLMTTIIGRVGGVIIIFFGLHFMGALPALFAGLRKNPAILNNVLTSFAVAAVGSIVIIWGFSPDLELASTETGTSINYGVGILIALPLVAIWLLFLFLGGSLVEPGKFWSMVLNRLENALYSDTRRAMVAHHNQGLGGSALMGIVFSAGWTPCIGPIYGAVLTLAANTGDVSRAAPLLMAYSLGLGIPFLLTALLLDGAQGILRRVQRHMHKIELVSGAFLVFIGVLVATGRLQELSQNFANQFADFSVKVETCIVGFATGELHLNHVGACLGGRLVPAALDEPAQGAIERGSDTMEFVLAAKAGEKIDIHIENLVGTFTPSVVVFDPDGQEVGRNDSGQSATNEDGVLMPIQGLVLARDGLHTIRIANLEPSSGEAKVVFSLTVTPARETGQFDGANNTTLPTVRSIESLASSGPVIGTAIGNLAPDFTTTLDTGETVRLSEFRGKVVLLNFWATWCGPCRREMPEFQRAYRERADDGFTVLAINNRESLEDVTGFREELELTFPLALDEEGKIQNLFGIVSYPSTYVVDRNGVIIARHFGALTEAQIAELVNRALS